MGGTTTPTRRPVAASVDELLRDATEREPLLTSDSKSGARFERVVIGGERYVVKHLNLEDDWIMRATGDVSCRPVLVWESGILDLVPDCFDHAYVGAAREEAPGRHVGGAILMRDVSEWLVPEGEDPLPLDVHLQFMDHMARWHAAFWEWRDDIGFAPLSARYTEFSPAVVDAERASGFPDAVPEIAAEGWERFPAAAPRAAALVGRLQDDPAPLVEALEATPQAFLHGDWKMGNLGHRPDGRTVLVDWAVPGVGPGCEELAWYLALNRARLPEGHTKEDAVAAYRAALEGYGIDTGPWWDRQLGLCLLGALLQFGWEKALGDAEELAWWEDRALDGARWLHA